MFACLTCLLTRKKIVSDDFKNDISPSFVIVILSSSNTHFILYLNNFISEKWYDIIKYKGTFVVSIVTKPYINMFPNDIDIH